VPHFTWLSNNILIALHWELDIICVVTLTWLYNNRWKVMSCQSRGTVRMTVERISWLITKKVTCAVRESNLCRHIPWISTYSKLIHGLNLWRIQDLWFGKYKGNYFRALSTEVDSSPVDWGIGLPWKIWKMNV
jgi:hypothetical protein